MMSSVATMTPARSRCMVTVRTYAERERFMQRRQQLEQQHAAQVSAGLALSAARERGLRVERDRQDSQEAEREVTRLVRRNGPRHPPPPLPAPTTQLQDEQSAPAVPPPPPAAPVAPGSAVITTPSSASSQTPVTKVVTKPPLPSSAPPAPPASPPAATTTFRVNKIAASSAPQRGPSPAPYCPTPDYDSDSSGSTLHTTSTSWTAHGAKGPVVGKVPGPGATVPEVEMQSMDSLELLEPRPKEPRPPQTYFQHQPASRPSVCVTIREYLASSSSQPSKLSFLHSRPQQDGSGLGAKDVDGLQSELATTLSRSNLRSRTDLTDSSNEGHPKEAEEAPKLSEDVAHGNVTVTSINGNSSAPYLPKNSMPNGILKKASVSLAAPNGMPVGHGITPAILAGAGAALNRTKSNGVPTKTISFGAKATIINEKQVSS